MVLESVYMGKDDKLLNEMFDFYAPNVTEIIDVCCNRRRIWKRCFYEGKVRFYDCDFQWKPDVVCKWDALPDRNQSIDLIIYDPPHLPLAAASEKSLKRFSIDYGLTFSTKKDNIESLHLPFLKEAKRVLKYDGLIFAKIKDYIHNHKYQWNLELFNKSARIVGFTPCDLIIKRDPCGGNLKSGRWKNRVHVKNVHCYWVIIRNGKCEPKKKK